MAPQEKPTPKDRSRARRPAAGRLPPGPWRGSPTRHTGADHHNRPRPRRVEDGPGPAGPPPETGQGFTSQPRETSQIRYGMRAWHASQEPAVQEFVAPWPCHARMYRASSALGPT